jgi:hypothetical protein
MIVILFAIEIKLNQLSIILIVSIIITHRADNEVIVFNNRVYNGDIDSCGF